MTGVTNRTSRPPARGRLARNTLIVLFLVALMLVLTAGLAEIYLRLTVPFVTTNWPVRFDPRFGDTFEPGELVQHTNGVDYWTRTRVNSLGFLDREPPPSRSDSHSDSGCRVLFIGDSLVEALQVPIDRKFHVLFEHFAREQLPALGIKTLAFSHSGTGQANQLAYYEFFGPAVQPDVVVLVVGGSDFADNSPLLASVIRGWHPRHLPRLIFAITPDGKRISRQPIDPDWRQYRLSDQYMTPRPAHRFLHKHSYFYNWLFTHLQAHLPVLALLLSGQPSQAEYVNARLRDIEQIDGFSQAFAQWNYPHDSNISTMFNAADPLPPVFAQALRLTGHALDEFQRHAREDGFRLLLLAGHGFSDHFEPGTVEKGRTLRDRGALLRLETLAGEHGIPLIDQYDFILAHGGDLNKARFSLDSHWSEQGHIWAAEAMLEYFREHPQVCSEHVHMPPDE